MKNEPKIACPACGAANRLGVFVCSHCGARMYADGKAPPLLKEKTVGGPRSAVRNALLAGLAVLLIVSMLLALWPFSLVGDSSGRAEDVLPSLVIIERQLNEGVPVTAQTIREGDLNSFFARKGLPGKELKVDVSAGRLVWIAREAIGPFTLGTRVVLVRDVATRKVSVQSAWVGHLPMPTSAAQGLVRGVVRRFQYQLPESIWKELVIARLDAGALVVGAPHAVEAR